MGSKVRTDTKKKELRDRGPRRSKAKIDKMGVELPPVLLVSIVPSARALPRLIRLLPAVPLVLGRYESSFSPSSSTVRIGVARSVVRLPHSVRLVRVPPSIMLPSSISRGRLVLVLVPIGLRRVASSCRLSVVVVCAPCHRVGVLSGGR